MPRSPGVSSAQASSPRSPAAQFEELDCSTQTLKKLIQFKQSNMKSTSRGENDEMKNEYSLRKRLHMSWIPSPAKKKNQKQAKICAGDQTLEEGVEGEEGKWASAGMYGSP